MCMVDWLIFGGLFCVYKYDFLIVYGLLCDFIEYELVNKWVKYCDLCLICYDDILEIMGSCLYLCDCCCEVFVNIIFFSLEEVVLFFFFISYVICYIEQEGGEDYVDCFIVVVCEIESVLQVVVNFDIYVFIVLNC